MFRFLPEQASEFAPRVDWINNLITDISVFFTVAIVGTMIYFAIIYRKRKGVDHETHRIEGSHLLEIIWTAVPTVVCIFVAAYGFVIYEDVRRIPEDKNAITINVHAQKWKWDFEYSNGKKTANEWTVPVDEPVKLIMTSADVLHSLFVPAMRVKQDVIPKQYTYLWFKPVKTGTYHTFCTEYCGTNHSGMLATLNVVSKAEYERWLADDSDALKMSRMKPSDMGKELYVKKGCNACHSLDGSRIVGPSFLKLFGREEELESGEKIKADENYIKNSVLNPNSQIVKTFPPNQMPSFQGQLSDDDIHGIIEFIKTVDGSQKVEVAAAPVPALNPNASPAERGKFNYETKLCKTCHTLDGSKLIGPTFKGVYGRSEKLADGSTITVDDAYIKKSIKEPASQIVEGYPPSMPQLPLSDGDIADIIEFMKTLK
jgi:cytochrome c oxidase subunit 2